MRRSKYILPLSAALLLSACQHTGQNVYRYNEVGKASLVNFGTIVAMREVAVQGQNTGLGAAAGGAAGGLVGSQFGNSGGNAAAILAGVVIGGVAGALAEQAAADRTATEYTVTLENGVTMTVVQDHNEGETPLHPGQRVMIQVTGGTQRVIAAGALPTSIKRPQGIKVTD